MQSCFGRDVKYIRKLRMYILNLRMYIRNFRLYIRNLRIYFVRRLSVVFVRCQTGFLALSRVLCTVVAPGVGDGDGQCVLFALSLFHEDKLRLGMAGV